MNMLLVVGKHTFLMKEEILMKKKCDVNETDEQAKKKCIKYYDLEDKGLDTTHKIKSVFCAVLP